MRTSLIIRTIILLVIYTSVWVYVGYQFGRRQANPFSRDIYNLCRNNGGTEYHCSVEANWLEGNGRSVINSTGDGNTNINGASK